MKIRGDASAVSQGPDTEHALLAAFLEATNRIDGRVLQRTVALSRAPKLVDLEPVDLEPVDLDPVNLEPVNLEALPTPHEANPASPEAHPAQTAPKSLVAPYTFRRANVVKA
jgi:hypothetical protein